MPNYCNYIVEVDSVPGIEEMTPFVPYYAIPTGCTYIDVVIKVPNKCYYISADNNQAPPAGPCGNAQDLQNTITLDVQSGCSDNTPTLITKRLNYCEDPNGTYLYIYVIDASRGGVLGGGAVGTKKVIKTLS